MSKDESLGEAGLPPPPPTWEHSAVAPPLVGLPAETGKLTPVEGAIAEEEEPVDELWADAKLEPMVLGESEKMWTQPSMESVVGPAPTRDELSTGAGPIAQPPAIPPAPVAAFPDDAPAKGKLPLILGAAGLLIGLIGLVVVLARDKGNGESPTAAAKTDGNADQQAAPPTPVPSQLPPPPPRIEGDLSTRAKTKIDEGDPQAGMELARELLAQDPEGNAEGFIELACLAEYGVDARKVFRPLQGPKARARLAEECDASGIDLYFKGDGPSADEYFRQAERAFEDEQWEDAYRLARSSSRVESSAKAIRIMALASCHSDDTAEAKRLLKMLLPKEQTEVEEACGGAL